MPDACQEALQSPALLLSRDLHVLTASPSYFQAFKASRAGVEGHPIWKTDHGRWNVPAVRALLEEVLAEEHPPRTPFTLSYEDLALGARVLFIAQRSFSDGHSPPLILLVIEVKPSLVDSQAANRVESPSKETRSPVPGSASLDRQLGGGLSVPGSIERSHALHRK